MGCNLKSHHLWRSVCATCLNAFFAFKLNFEMVLRRDLVDNVSINMPKQLHSAAVQTETIQLTEATTQTEAAMNLLALPPPLHWPGKCSVVPRVCSMPNPTLKRSASSPPDFGKDEHEIGRWRMRDSVSGIITYPERFEMCRFSTRCHNINDLKMNTHFEGGGGLQQQHKLQLQHIPQQTAAAEHVAAASSGSGSTRRRSRRPVDFCLRSSRWRDAKGRYCRAPSPATGRRL